MWVTYDSEENCETSREILEKVEIKGYFLNPVKSHSQKKPIRITPPLSDNCEQRDLKLVNKLVQVFD